MTCSDTIHKNMEKVIDLNLIDKESLISTIICYFKSITTKQYYLPESELRKLVCNFTEKYIETICDYNKVKCEIQPTTKMCGGYTSGSVIVISEKIFEEFKNGNFPEIINIAVHESTHVKQKELCKENYVSFYEIEKLKDRILSKNLDNYYEQNYILNFNEIEAYKSGLSSEMTIKEKYNNIIEKI